MSRNDSSPSAPLPGKTTIAFTHGGGRFANQLMTFGHLIGLVAEHPSELEVENHAFWPYAPLCDGTVDNPMCRYPADPNRPGLSAYARVIKTIQRILPRRRERAVLIIADRIIRALQPWRSLKFSGNPGFSLGSSQFLDLLKGRSRVYLHAWQLRDWGLFEKHQEAVRTFLQPVERFQAPSRVMIADLRKRHDVLVGLLIRQDDYRLWADGKYFFPSEAYRNFIVQLRERFGPNSAVVMASDEIQPPGMFDNLNAYWCTGAMGQPGHYLESFVQLSMCDVIAGPPSTFSAWASFFGRKPLLPIQSATDDLRSAELLPGHLLDAKDHPVLSRAVQ